MNDLFIPIPENLTKHYKYKGIEYNELIFKQIYEYVCTNQICDYYNYIKNKTFGKSRYFGTTIKTILENIHLYVVCDINKLNSIGKKYAAYMYSRNIRFITPLGIKSILKKIYLPKSKRKEPFYFSFNRSYGTFYNWDDKIFYLILRLLKKKILDKITYYDNDCVTQSYIDSIKLEKQRNVRTKIPNEITVYKIRKSERGNYGNVINCVSEQTILCKKEIKNSKILSIYCNKGDERIKNLWGVFYNSEYRLNFYEIAPTKIHELKGINNYIYIDEFMKSKFKIIRNIGTMYYILQNFPELREINKISNLYMVTNKGNDIIKKLSNFIEKNSPCYNTLINKNSKQLIVEMYEICIKDNNWNFDIKDCFDMNVQFLKDLNVLLLFTQKISYSNENEIPENRLNICIDYLLARGKKMSYKNGLSIVPNLDAVKKLNKQTIYNKLNENNQNK